MFQRLYFHEVPPQYLVKKCNEQLERKKKKEIFQIKKDFITCSNLIINELVRCPTRSDNLYFAMD